MADEYGAMQIPLVVPPAATRIQYPSKFEDWTAAKVTADDGTEDTTDADGGPKASEITETTDSGAQTHQLSLTALNDTAGTVTFSVCGKAGTRDWIELLDAGATASAYFDLTNGVVGTETGCTGSITSLGSGWYRCTIAYTHAVAGGLQIRLANADGGDSYTGNGSSLYLYDAQFARTDSTWETISDPGLDILLAYLKAYINQYGQTAWDAVAPGEPIVRTVFAKDPRRAGPRAADCPSLWAHRSRIKHEQLADGYRSRHSQIEIIWIFPPADPVKHADHAPALHGLDGLIDSALDKGRDASYVLTGDTYSGAATRGTVIQRYCGWNQMRPGDSYPATIVVTGREPGGEVEVDALMSELNVTETIWRDPTVHAEDATVIEGDVTRVDGTLMGEFQCGHPCKAYGTPLEAFELDHTDITKPGNLIEIIPGWLDPDTYRLTASGAARPTYEATGWGGTKPSMLLNGTAQRMICDAIAAAVTGHDKPWSMIWALQWVAHTAGRTAWSLGSSTDAVPYMQGYSDGNTQTDTKRQDELGTNDTALGTAAMSARCIYGLSFNGKLLTTHVDQTKELDEEDIDVGNLPLDRFAIGCLRTTTETQFANIRVGALWLYAEALSDENIVAASAKMAERWPTA